MKLRVIPGLFLLAVFFLPFTVESKRIAVKGGTYWSLHEVGLRYGMREQGSSLADRKRFLSFRKDKRLFTINGVRYILNFTPLAGDGTMYLCDMDVYKQLDPILRPWDVPNHPVRHIVIDPGHGGRDAGAIRGGWREKDLTLRIAMRVRDRLIRAGYRVTLTRHTDIALTLSQRAALARALKADLFLSIHINAAENAAISGIETFAMTPAGAPSSTNAKAEKTSHPGNRCDVNNLALASMIHRYLLGRTGGADRGVKRARFQVLREITMPGVLIECGFISNPTEARRMMSAEYQEKLAKGIADGVHAYRLSIMKNRSMLKK